MNHCEEYAKTEFEYNGKRWQVTIKDYWVIPGKPIEPVWSLHKPDDCGGWLPAVGNDNAPKAVCWMATCFYRGFMAGSGIQEK